MSDDEIRGAGPLADADLRPDDGGDDTGGDGESAPGGLRAALLGWYRRNVGEPEQLRDVYLGFALFFGGVAMGLVGLALFVAERTAFGGQPYWTLRKVAFAVAALGLPTLLVGVVTLLPVDRRALAASGVGYAVTVCAVGAFAWIYPYNWNVDGATDYAPVIVSVYAVGLVAVVAASGSALVSYHVERTAPAAAERAESADGTRSGNSGGPGGSAGGEPVRDADVEADIEEAMEATEMTWGGVEKDDSREISVSSDVGGDQSAFDDVEVTETRSSGSGVDDAVANLKGLKGGEERTGRGSGTDEQTAALRELKREREAQEVARDPTLGERVKEFLGRDD